MIAMFVKSNHRDWEAHIHELRDAINTATQASTKVSPAFLNFGRHPRPVKSLRREVEGPREIVKIERTEWKDRVKRLDALRDLVAHHIDSAREKQERYYNGGKRDVRFFVGDAVMRRTHHLSEASRKFNAKLALKFEGPYVVKEVKSACLYNIEKAEGKGKGIRKVHVSDLKRYVPPRWAISRGVH